MSKNFRNMIIKSLLLTGLCAIGINMLMAQENIYGLLPEEKCSGMKINGEPSLYAGDDLFSLINGGAELYHEFGFVEVLAAELMSSTEMIVAEIYDMGSPDAAWGIFSMTASNQATAIDLGDTARRGEGFLQCIKDRYMLYIYYEKTDVKSLKRLANCIMNKIPDQSTPPYVAEIIGRGTSPEARLMYFRGNLGLSSVYTFHYKDVFGYLEGASAEFDDIKVFLLKYRSATDGRNKFSIAAEFFLQSNKYLNRVFNEASFHVLDKKENQIDCYLEGDYILVLVYPPAYEIDDVRTTITDMIYNY